MHAWRFQTCAKRRVEGVSGGPGKQACDQGEDPHLYPYACGMHTDDHVLTRKMCSRRSRGAARSLALPSSSAQVSPMASSHRRSTSHRTTRCRHKCGMCLSERMFTDYAPQSVAADELSSTDSTCLNFCVSTGLLGSIAQPLRKLLTCRRRAMQSAVHRHNICCCCSGTSWTRVCRTSSSTPRSSTSAPCAPSASPPS